MFHTSPASLLSALLSAPLSALPALDHRPVVPDLEQETVILLDFESHLACEGVHHDRGLSGHQPTEPGAFMVISPCCGPKVIQCRPRVAEMRASGVLYCGVCQTEHLTSEYTFLPL
jgi:hypothetical protein